MLACLDRVRRQQSRPGIVQLDVEADRVVGRAENESKLKESKELINQIGGFIYDMRHDRELPDLKTGNKLS